MTNIELTLAARKRHEECDGFAEDNQFEVELTARVRSLIADLDDGFISASEFITKIVSE